LLHATFLIAEHCWKRLTGKEVAAVLVFPLVTFAWIFFRADHVSDAFYIVGHLASNWSGAALHEVFHHGPVNVYMMVGLVIFLLIAESKPGRGWYDAVVQPNLALRWVSYYALVTAIIMCGTFNNTRFIYFQF
jgi:hypothetical protein